MIFQSYNINYNNPGFNKEVNYHYNQNKPKVRTEIKQTKKNVNKINSEFPRINPNVPKLPINKRHASSSMDNKIQKNIRTNKINIDMVNPDNKLKNKQLNQSPNKIEQEPKENINLMINPINNYRLPKEFKDITFDTFKSKKKYI